MGEKDTHSPRKSRKQEIDDDITAARALVTAEIAAAIAADSAIDNVVEDTTPQLGGDLDLNEKAVEYNSSPTTDLTYNGKKALLTAGANVVWGDIAMLQSDGKYDSADASAEATGNGHLVFATETAADTETFDGVIEGFIRDDSWNWTIGGPIYLSETTGELTQTAPVTSSAIVRIVGYAISADVIWFSPDNYYTVIP